MTDEGTKSTGKGIYIWDHVSQGPVYTSVLDGVRFGGVSVKVNNRYMPDCKGNMRYFNASMKRNIIFEVCGSKI